MKLSRMAALALSLALGAVALGTATPAEARPKCPSFFCFIEPDGNCSCEWILCPDGNYYCGRNYN